MMLLCVSLFVTMVTAKTLLAVFIAVSLSDKLNRVRPKFWPYFIPLVAVFWTLDIYILLRQLWPLILHK